MKPSITIIAALLTAVAMTMTGCTVSEETKGYTNQALCVTGDATVSSLEGGGAAARAAASLVRDNTDNPRIRDISQRIINGDTDEALREELSQWVTNACS